MYLQRLEIFGFKSFAKRTILEFLLPADSDSRGITSVVGPNGSGKSNIADAVRWVLGEQSLKLLRGKKSDDVIFSGSDSKSKLSTAQVSLYLDNSDHSAAIDYSEVVITRRIYRDGEGEYLINKNPVRLIDIALLLARSNMGQKTYSVIGQGMIDSVINATCAERKDFFYEAAGVKELQIKKHQAENKLVKTKDNLRQTEITLNEIEPHLKLLTRQVKKLEQREETEKELTDREKRYYQGILKEIKIKYDELETEYKNFTVEETVVTSEINHLTAELNQLEQAASRTQVFNDLEQEYKQINYQKSGILRELANLQGKLDLNYERSGNLNIVWINQRLAEIEEELTKATRDEERNREETTKQERIINEKLAVRQAIETEQKTIDRKVYEVEDKLIHQDNSFDHEFLGELKIIHQAQKALVASFDKVISLEELGELKKSAVAISDRLNSLTLRALADKDDGREKEIFTWQQELNHLMIKKSEITAEINRLEGGVRLLTDKSNLVGNEINRLEREKGQLTAKLKEGENKDINKDVYVSELKKSKHKLEAELSVYEEKLKVVGGRINDFNHEEELKKQELIAIQRRYQEIQHKLSQIITKKNNLRVELTKLEVRRDNLYQEIYREFPDNYQNLVASILAAESLSLEDKNYLEGEIIRLKHKLELIGGIDEESVKEYEEVKSRCDFLRGQYDDLIQAVADLEELVVELDKNIDLQFNSSFNKINKEFEKFFQILFSGGKASLEKVMVEENITSTENSGNMETVGEISLQETIAELAIGTKEEAKKTGGKIFAGIDICACPPGKKIKYISMLSGGEKALASLALICAIVSINPAPFVILDEVDAALDEANSEKMADILERLSQKTQFIVITHNRATMRRSNILYGVSMGGDGISNLLSLHLDEAEKMVRRRE